MLASRLPWRPGTLVEPQCDTFAGCAMTIARCSSLVGHGGVERQRRPPEDHRAISVTWRPNRFPFERHAGPPARIDSQGDSGEGFLVVESGEPSSSSKQPNHLPALPAGGVLARLVVWPSAGKAWGGREHLIFRPRNAAGWKLTGPPSCGQRQQRMRWF